MILPIIVVPCLLGAGVERPFAPRPGLEEFGRLRRVEGERSSSAGAWAAVETPPLAPRLAALPRARFAGREVAVAIGPRARLLGLAWLPLQRAGSGLLIPGCASIHTFGMRFPLDVVFLDGAGRVLALQLAVRPRRLLCHRRARAVLEIPARPGGRVSGAQPLGPDAAAPP